MDYEDLYKALKDEDGHKLILGQAGYGKSHLIKRLWNEGVENILYCAPTGLAALNMHGVTIHSLFNFKPCIIIPDIEANNMREDKKELLRKARTLLIDECSMIRYDILYVMDMILRYVRGNDKPFGGINLVLVGDLFQLGTVTSYCELYKIKELYPETKDKYYLPFFDTPVFQSQEFQSRLNVYELTHNFRQDSDVEYATRLMELRYGLPTQETLDYFNTRYNPKTEPRFCITPSWLNVIKYNSFMYNMLDSREWVSEAIITPPSKMEDKRVSICHIAKTLRIKIGMPIMFVLNDTKNEARRFVNGTFGTIIDVKATGNEIESVTVEIEDKEKNKNIIEVERTDFLIHEPKLDEEDKRFKYKCRAKINNFPFIQAWALTIHRAQGQTLSNYQVDLMSAGWLPFAGYVAMSRGRSLNDITLRCKLKRGDFIPRPEVMEFYHNLSSRIIPVTYSN